MNRSRAVFLGVLATLFSSAVILNLPGCSSCDQNGEGKSGAGVYQRGGQYERSDEDLEQLPEKDPQRLQPQPHFKKFRPEEPNRP